MPANKTLFNVPTEAEIRKDLRAVSYGSDTIYSNKDIIKNNQIKDKAKIKESRLKTLIGKYKGSKYNFKLNKDGVSVNVKINY